MTATMIRGSLVTAADITDDTVHDYAIKYERTACSRCNGTGTTAFTWVRDGACFGCHGSGRKLTSAGEAGRARVAELMDELLGVPAADLAAGDKVQYEGRFRLILAIREEADDGAVRLDFGRYGELLLTADQRARRYGRSEWASVLRAALDVPGVTVFCKDRPQSHKHCDVV